VLFTGSSIGGLIAPALASLLFAFAGWRFAFFTSAIVGLIWIPIWVGLTFRRDVSEVLDVAPASVPRSIRFRDLLREPAAIRAIIGVVACAPIIAFMLLWGPKYLGEVHRVKQEDVGGYAWLPPLLFDLGAIGFGDLASRLRGNERAVRGLFAVGLLIGMAMAFAPAIADGPWSATIAISISMVGGGAMYTILTADLMARMPMDSISLGSSLLAASQSLTYIIMNPLVGMAVDRQGHYDGVLLFLGLWTIPGAAIWILWRPREISASRSGP
jgi:ACS family hexuronate transporter-like MFS transporter